jgi:hypothetical protein
MLKEFKAALFSWVTDKVVGAMLGGGLIAAIILYAQTYLLSLPQDAKLLLVFSVFVFGYASCLKVSRKWGVGAERENPKLRVGVRGDFEGDVLTVSVHNFGKLDDFSAQITYAIPLQEYPPLPMGVRWRNQNDPVATIGSLNFAVLEVLTAPVGTPKDANHGPLVAGQFLRPEGLRAPFNPRWVKFGNVYEEVHIFITLLARKQELSRKINLTVNVAGFTNQKTQRTAIAYLD